MDYNGKMYCDWCIRYIPHHVPRVSFATKDYHVGCWKKEQQHLTSLISLPQEEKAHAVR